MVLKLSPTVQFTTLVGPLVPESQVAIRVYFREIQDFTSRQVQAVEIKASYQHT